MPEGPEVKIASDYYNSFFKDSVNFRFNTVTEYYKQKYHSIFQTLRTYHPTSFSACFTVGKNLFIPLNKNRLFNFHLGMTGGWSHQNEKHCHFRVSSSSGDLFFKDVRKFGKMRILSTDEFDLKHIPQFDLLNQLYDFEAHLSFLSKKISSKKSICSALMNQTYFPGVGNYIKSEALYATKIHPEKKWGQLSKRSIKRLILNTKEIMQTSYRTGGAELNDFKNPFNQSRFSLKVYGKSTDIEGNKVVSQLTSDQRKSWFCPKIQK